MSKRSSFDIIGLEDNLDHHDHQQSYVISIRDAEGPQMLRVKFDPLGPLKPCIVNTTIIIIIIIINFIFVIIGICRLSGLDQHHLQKKVLFLLNHNHHHSDAS